MPVDASLKEPGLGQLAGNAPRPLEERRRANTATPTPSRTRCSSSTCSGYSREGRSTSPSTISAPTSVDGNHGALPAASRWLRRLLEERQFHAIWQSVHESMFPGNGRIKRQYVETLKKVDRERDWSKEEPEWWYGKRRTKHLLLTEARGCLVRDCASSLQYPWGDSNARTWLRRPLLYPLSEEVQPVVGWPP